MRVKPTNGTPLFIQILESEDQSDQSEEESPGPMASELSEVVSRMGSRRGSLQGPELHRVLSLVRRHSTGQAVTLRYLLEETHISSHA